MASSAKKQKLSRDLHNRGKQDGRSSPEINCPICLERIEDRAFANKCFHSFCKTCLVEWSKVKAECPVCRQRFEKIIYNVKAMDDYQEETVQRQQFMDLPCWHNLDGVRRSMFFGTSTASSSTHHHFRYPAMTSGFSRVLELQSLIDNFHNVSRLSLVISSPTTATRHTSVTSHHNVTPPRDLFPPSVATSEFRRYVYRSDLWVMTFGNGDKKKYRESSAEFYRRNPACTHRLVPWLNREFVALVPSMNCQTMVDMIMRNLKIHNIVSDGFRRIIEPFIGNNTDHFIHEFYNFARSCYDMEAYSQIARYVPKERADFSYLRDTSSSSTQAQFPHADPSTSNNSDSDDSVIVVDSDSSESETDVPLTPGRDTSPSNHVSDSRETATAVSSINVNIDAGDREVSVTLIDDFDNPTAGPSGVKVCKVLSTLIEKGSDSETDIDVGKDDLPLGFENELPNEHSEESDDSVQIVNILKPRHERTPEIIDVIESDNEYTRTNDKEDPKELVQCKEEKDSHRDRKHRHKKHRSRSHKRSKHKKEKKRKRSHYHSDDSNSSSSSDEESSGRYWTFVRNSEISKLKLKRFHWSSSDEEDLVAMRKDIDPKVYSSDEKPQAKLQSVIVSPASQSERSRNHTPDFQL